MILACLKKRKEERRERREKGDRKGRKWKKSIFHVGDKSLLRTRLKSLRTIGIVCLLDFSVKVSHYGTRFVRFLSYKFFLHKFYGYVIMYIEVCEYPIFLEDYNLSKCSIFVPFSAFYLVLENNVASPAFQ